MDRYDYPDYQTFIAESRKARHARYLTTIARAYVLVDAHAHRKQDLVRRVWNDMAVQDYPPTKCQMLSAGAPKAAIARLRQGNLNIDDCLGHWTGGFLHGLKLSGAILQKEPGRYRIDSKLHPEVVGDIQNWRLAGRLGSADRSGRHRLVACPAIAHLPPEDPVGADVVAGLFAGARLSLIHGEHWLELPDNERTRQLLTDWTILHYPSRQIHHRTFIKVSPFYAPLFANLLPEHSRERILGIKKAAMCPLLPILYWEMRFSLLEKGMPVLPFTNALPFGISRRSFYRHGWRRKDLHRRSVLEVGILSVDSRLRMLMSQWFTEHQQRRLN